MSLTKKDRRDKQYQHNTQQLLGVIKKYIGLIEPRTARDMVNIMLHVVTSMQSHLDAADAPPKLCEASTAPRQTGKTIIGPRPAEANQKTKKKEQKTTKKEK